VADADEQQLVAWLDSLSYATNSRAATNKNKTGGMWVELVTVRKNGHEYYYIRLMRWIPGTGKKYVRYLGTLENVKRGGGLYAAEAVRLERKRIERLSGAAGVDTGTRISVPS